MAADWIMVTGSNGLVGSAFTRVAIQAGYGVIGIDNNGRKEFFGADGDTSKTGQALQKLYGSEFLQLDHDVTNPLQLPLREAARRRHVVGIVHAAGQPSHDLAKRMIARDMQVNLGGTLLMLELNREYLGNVPFIFLSTNKVYGERPNRIEREELPTRFDFKDRTTMGISESMSIDQTDHSFFGVSKAAADLLVQEYGRNFDMPTACLRCGCITGAGHAGVELHGFLSYLVACAMKGKPYTVFGHGGKQLRDNIDADDLATLILQILKRPSAKGAVFNVGGGLENSCSILEAAQLVRDASGKTLQLRFEDTPRFGDHIVYYSDMSRAQHRYPEWRIKKSLPRIIDELVSRPYPTR